MPRAVLDSDRLYAIARRSLRGTELDDLLFASKAEVEGHDGAALTVSVTPDRLDLLSEGGLGLYLQGVLGTAHGIPAYGAPPSERLPHGFEVDRSVESIRPAIAGAFLRAPEGATLDAGLLAEAVRFQELVHATIGRNRRAASLGIYPVDRLAFPVRYSLEPMRSVRFVPLDGADEVGADAFFAGHPMATTYGPLGRSGDACLTLRDANGTVLSLPPILNGRTAGEARVGDRTLLIESTGTRERTVFESVGLMLVPFVAQGWTVAAVPRDHPGGVWSDGASVVEPHSIDFPSAVLRTLGGEGLSAAVVERRLSESRLVGHPHAGGWKVEAPPWRPDLMTAVDVGEDVLLAEGVRPEDGILPASRTRGRLRHETMFRRRFASALLGLGLASPHTPVLVSDTAVARVGGPAPLHLRNPVSAEFSYLRPRLLLSHLEVLAHNVRHGYPQRFGEVAPVIVAAPGSETGADTRYHAGVVVASDSAGFADAAAMVDYLLRTVDVTGVREPTEISGIIAGRAARVRVAGEVVAEMGEVAPAILSEIGVPVPVAWAELDLTALWPLVARRDTD
jgi:phenylalanyl-tRNA synthetase beta chain